MSDQPRLDGTDVWERRPRWRTLDDWLADVGDMGGGEDGGNEGDDGGGIGDMDGTGVDNDDDDDASTLEMGYPSSDTDDMEIETRTLPFTPWTEIDSEDDELTPTVIEDDILNEQQMARIMYQWFYILCRWLFTTSSCC